MTCEKAMSLMSAYLDKELGFDEFRQVELHLAYCEACSQEYESLKATKELLGTLRAAELPREFWPELRERLGAVAAEERVAPARAKSSSSARQSSSRQSRWRGILRPASGGGGGSLFSSPMVKALVPAFLVLVLATLSTVWSAHRRPAEAQMSSRIDSIEPYFRDYVISEYDRPLSDKTSVGFVVTGQAVTMYTSDLLGPSSKVTRASSLREASPSPPNTARNEYTLISYPR